MLPKVISKEQSAFLSNRQILDGALVMSEVIDFGLKKKKKGIIFKIDFKKTYDSVNWSFLDYILRRLGFGR